MALSMSSSAIPLNAVFLWNAVGVVNAEVVAVARAAMRAEYLRFIVVCISLVYVMMIVPVFSSIDGR